MDSQFVDLAKPNNDNNNNYSPIGEDNLSKKDQDQILEQPQQSQQQEEEEEEKKQQQQRQKDNYNSIQQIESKEFSTPQKKIIPSSSEIPSQSSSKNQKFPSSWTKGMNSYQDLKTYSVYLIYQDADDQGLPNIQLDAPIQSTIEDFIKFCIDSFNLFAKEKKKNYLLNTNSKLWELYLAKKNGMPKSDDYPSFAKEALVVETGKQVFSLTPVSISESIIIKEQNIQQKKQQNIVDKNSQQQQQQQQQQPSSNAQQQQQNQQNNQNKGQIEKPNNINQMQTQSTMQSQNSQSRTEQKQDPSNNSFSQIDKTYNNGLNNQSKNKKKDNGKQYEDSGRSCFCFKKQNNSLINNLLYGISSVHKGQKSQNKGGSTKGKPVTKKKVITLEDKYLQEKKSGVVKGKQSQQNLIIPKYNLQRDQYTPDSNKRIVRAPSDQSKIIRTLDFQQFTESLQKKNNPQLMQEVIQLQKNDNEKVVFNQYFAFPWDFSGKIVEAPQEKNLKAPLDVHVLIDEPRAIALFKDFVDGLSSYDYPALEVLLERAFYRKISKQLKILKSQNYQIKVQGLRNKFTRVDLFQIKNIFGVGLYIDRRKNDGFDNYRVSDEILFDSVPTTTYIKKMLEGDEKASIIIQMHISFECSTSLSIMKENSHTVDIQDKISLGQDKKGIHVMIIEVEILRADYKSLKINLASKGYIDDQNIKQFKQLLHQQEFKIVDFDNYMNGNDIARMSYDPAL